MQGRSLRRRKLALSGSASQPLAMASRKNRRGGPQRDRKNGDLDNREVEIKGHSKRKSAASMEGSPPVRKRQRVGLHPRLSSLSGKEIWSDSKLNPCSGWAPQTDDDVRIVREIRRPGVPAATSITAFIVPDRPSPPFRDDDPVGGCQPFLASWGVCKA